MNFIARSVALVGAVLLTVTFGLASTATASVQLSQRAQNSAVRSLASHEKVKRATTITVNGNRVTVQQMGFKWKAEAVGAFRSSVNPALTRIDIVANAGRFRYTALVRKTGSSKRLLYWGQRFDIIDYLCARRSPDTLAVHDLGLGPVSKGAYGVKRCKYERDLRDETTSMSAPEIAGLRQMYDLVYGEQPDGGVGFASPVTPDFKEASADCDWTGGETAPPAGRVSKADPRFAVLDIACVTGSVNGAPALGSTQLLVSRPGKSGSFTRLLAHVKPSWSMQASECLKDRRWPLSLRVRVTLDFCSPFPSIILTQFNGQRGL